MRESKLWFLHIMSGAALIILLGLHTVIMHFDTVLGWLGLAQALGSANGGPLEFGNVLMRMQSASHTAVYLLLLFIGLYHGLYGLRSLIFEIPCSAKAKHAVSYLLVLIGLVVACWGSYTILLGYFNPPTLNQ